MKIVLVPSTSLEEEQEIETLVERFLENYFGSNLNEYIETFFITEDSYYLPIVKKIDPKENITNDNKNIGIAKTIFVQRSRKSTIVIRNYFFLPFLKAIYQRGNINLWNLEELDSLYTIFHEIGHCIDNLKREEAKADHKRELRKPFRFSTVVKYYYEVISGEIGANINASKYLPDEFKEKGIATLIKQKDQACDDFKLHINKSFNELSELDSFSLIGIISILLLRIQEVYIHTPIEKRGAFNCFGNELDLYIKNWINSLILTYPNWSDGEKLFSEIITRLLNKYGVKKLEGEKRDSLVKMSRLSYLFNSLLNKNYFI